MTEVYFCSECELYFHANEVEIDGAGPYRPGEPFCRHCEKEVSEVDPSELLDFIREQERLLRIADWR